ncbi:RRP12-like protein isoform X1 [Saccostrea echinata]|uniref:RRP12-like protein isoform X1 n=3 Tax=Saccostrea echinata TaxID=191078 RepID=UPI002A7FD614|nr:RRP12-like protein isoform X1 [Saccostrea echinata]
MGSNKKQLKEISKQKKGKGKRWKKGQSSSSNPETKTFREAAKNRFFQTSKGESSLTVDALAKHDEEQADKDGDVSLRAESDIVSAAGKTFNTWATNWTECTNTTFSRVHRYWASNSAFHKEVLAVLAAVTEVIKTQGGSESETEYFAALMTALETTEGEESVSAVAYLLSLVMKRIPAPVLKSRFAEISKEFLDVLVKYSEGQSPALLKSLLLCLALLLRVQDQATWSNSSTQRVYQGLLAFTVNKKPKVRKAAQQGVNIVLRGSIFMNPAETAPPHHPASSMTAKFCIQVIEQCGGSTESSDTLYILSLLKDIMCTFSLSSLKSVCETILRVMTLSNVMVTSCGMKALYGLFNGNPRATTLNAELNAQMIKALYEYHPSNNDVQPLKAWLAVMEAAHKNLTRLDEKLCLGHLPRFFSVCMTCLLSEKAEVASSATKTMKELLRACLAPAVEGTKQVTSAPSSTNTPLHKIVKALETGLGYQFHAAWGLVMQVFAVMFEVAGKECPALFKKSLLSIANLRDSPRFPYKAELDHAVGAAIKYLGPRQVLEAVPLNITGDDDDYSFPRSWLLPVIRDNVCNTELGFFTIYFLPLAAKLRQRSLEAESTGNQVVCKSYDALQRQIWSLLPGFCTQPTDLAQSFKGICKILGSAISDREDLRTEVMSGLRKLINKSKEEEESKQEVARFAKNFLPILFNLFTTEPENAKDTTRLAVLETIKTYLQIADTALINSFCDKCKEKIHEEGVSPFKRHALMDLLLVMLPVVDQTRVEAIFKLTTPFLSDMDKTLQKKCYRVLEELCSSSSEACQMFVTENLSTIQGVLLDSLSTSSPSSKAPRLRCLINIFKILKEEEKDFLLAVVPEAILCTKEIGEKARSASYQLLVEMGRAKMRWNKNENEALEDYFQMVMAGLGGSPQMVSSTLLALTRILYEFKASISMPLLETIVEQLCLLLKSKTREVVKAALGFMKVLLSAYPDTVLAPHLKQIMSSLVSQKEDCKHHFRFKAKEIYAKLIKKFGYETIFGMSPPSIHKVLVNIKKTQERAKKKKKERDSDSEEESDQEHFRSQPESVDDLLRDTDSEEETETKPKRKTRDKTQAKLAWLQEGGDIMDFLDPTASKKVLATKPEEKKDMKKREPAFKMASDGRLIITESSDEEGPEKMGEDEDDLEDLLKAIEQGAGNVKKTKKRKVEDLGSDDEASAPKYKAGGGGIHRPLAKVKRSAPQEAGSEYRAKKAGGDIKKTGRPDPYAYLPLNFQALNKRKKAKMAGRFTNLVKGAKKGAKKGYKGKKKT